MKKENVFLSRIEDYIKTLDLLDSEQPVIVGLSGGQDSVVLLDILVRLNYKCIAAHCNFSLRGDESDRDNLFARELAESIGIEFRDIVFKTKEYASQEKISIEMACRELRYNWFEELRTEYQAQAIVVGHHMDDSIETMLLNLIRGTGVAGLTGIRTTNGHIVRPLLCLNQDDIESYVKERELPFVTDSSNLEDVFMRNKIRHQLIPVLQKLNPSVSESLLRTMENLADTEKIYLQAVHDIENKIVTYDENEIRISIPDLLETPSPKAVLYELLKDYGFSSSQIKEINASLTGMSGKQFYSPIHRLVKDRDSLILDKRIVSANSDLSVQINKNTKEINNPIVMDFEIVDYTPDFVIPRESSIACFDADLLTFPLTLRTWQQGDRFNPFGMQGSKKVSDYFSDNKFSILDKERSYILCSENEIMWIVGERMDNRFRITDKTRQVMIVNIEEV